MKMSIYGSAHWRLEHMCKIDKGKAGMTYLQARKGNDISTVLIMRQMLTTSRAP